MITLEVELTHLSWAKLLQDINELLLLDEEKINQNKSYYRKLYVAGNVEETKLARIYRNIEHDQERFNHVSELVSRLSKQNYVMMLGGIDYCFNQETKIQGKPPTNFRVTVEKRNQQFTTYYMPLSNN